MWGWGWGGHGGYMFPYSWIGTGFSLIVFAAVVVVVYWSVYCSSRMARGSE